MIKKLLALVLSVIMVASLAACGGENTDETNTSEKIEYVYMQNFFDWGFEDSENSYVDTYGVINGYLLGVRSDWNTETGELTQEILKYNIADGTQETILYTPETTESINFVSMNPDGTIFVCAEGYQVDENTGEGQPLYHIAFLDAAGQITQSIDLSKIYAEMAEKYDYVYVHEAMIDDDQVIYLAFAQEIVAIKSNGKKLFSVKPDNMIQALGSTVDGDIYAICFGENGTEINMINKKAKAFGKKYELSNYNISGGFDMAENGILYYSDTTALHKINLETSVSEEVLRWQSEDLDGECVGAINYIDENTFFISYQDWNVNKEVFVKLVKTDYDVLMEQYQQGISSYEE